MMYKNTLFIVLSTVLFAVFTLASTPSSGMENKDMRQIEIAARKKVEQLAAEAAAEKEAARREAAESRAEITKDRATLEAEISRLEKKAGQLEGAVSSLDSQEKTLAEEEIALNAKLSQADSVIKELVGVIRIHAKDLHGLIADSLQTALDREGIHFLEEIAAAKRFPGLADISRMNALTYNQLASSGAVRITHGSLVDRAGNTADAEILVLGNFTAAYRLGDETGFLKYSAAGNKLYALSRLPSSSQQKQLNAYMNGKSDAVPIDISRGGALRQLISTPTLTEEIQSGGPLIWPILIILALGTAIFLERLIFLYRSRMDSESLIANIEAFSKKGEWQSCAAECRRLPGKPLARVIAAGLAFFGMPRETMENALQEAILKEIPKMERFLSTLAMLAAIAPLLGLLGTVTGMIDTFQVITLFGTGDPRLMSGGISVALVTTMLGLSVAIPIMLGHSLINRTVDNRIAELEEKAVALVNFSEKYRNGLE